MDKGLWQINGVIGSLLVSCFIGLAPEHWFVIIVCPGPFSFDIDAQNVAVKTICGVLFTAGRVLFTATEAGTSASFGFDGS